MTHTYQSVFRNPCRLKKKIQQLVPFYARICAAPVSIDDLCDTGLTSNHVAAWVTFLNHLGCNIQISRNVGKKRIVYSCDQPIDLEAFLLQKIGEIEKPPRKQRAIPTMYDTQDEKPKPMYVETRTGRIVNLTSNWPVQSSSTRRPYSVGSSLGNVYSIQGI